MISRTAGKPSRFLFLSTLGLMIALLGVEPIHAAVPPPNDDFDSARAIPSLPYSDSLDTTAATEADDDPDSCFVGPTVWYSFVPSADMRIQVDAVGSNYSPGLAAFRGARGSLNLVACGQGSGVAFEVAFNATAGTKYYFEVTERSEPLSLVFNARVAPDNDALTDAPEIGPFPYADQVNTVGATSGDYGDSSLGCVPSSPHVAEKTVWYRFTPTRHWMIEINTFGSDYDTIVSAQGYVADSATQEFSCNDDAEGTFQSELRFRARAGQRLAVMVGSKSRVGGNLTFSAHGYRIIKLGLDISRSEVKYGRSATVTAQLDVAAQTDNKIISIYARPFGGDDELVASGAVDSNGTFSTRVTPRKRTTYYARWSGDDQYWQDTSPEKTIKVHPRTKGELIRRDGTSGKYALYQGRTWYRTTVIPDHPGDVVELVLQAYDARRNRWVTVDETKLRLNQRSSVLAYVTAPKGFRLRIKSRFNGDNDHLGDDSRWAYFKRV